MTALLAMLSSADSGDLNLPARGVDGFASPLADERPRQRRDIRQGSPGWIGLVLADDVEGLGAAVRSTDGNGRPEANFGVVGGRRRELGGRSPGAPVAEIAGEARPGGPVLTNAVEFGLQPLDFGLDRRQTFRRDEITMRRDRPLRQFVGGRVAVLLPDEGSAHGGRVGRSSGGVKPSQGYSAASRGGASVGIFDTSTLRSACHKS